MELVCPSARTSYERYNIMLKETSLCMGCMCDKTYDGPCKLCGYSDDAPSIPSYLCPKTYLNDRYIVGKVISYNGEGAVYVGFDTATGTRVTIKEFMPDTLCSRKRGEEAVTVNNDMLPLYKTYLSEFVDLNKTLMKSRGMAHLQTVLDIFYENNTAYAVLEYINGIPLQTYLANSSGVLNWEQIKELFPPIFTTLSLVHAAGIIHRGISLSTIYVTDKLELKLTGFAISAARTTNTEIACEVFAGFAAPEQYNNDINGTWTDVYGIAAVLYRCLTGCNPTEAIARTGSSMPEPMMINRNVPSTVSGAIMRGLNLSTEGRTRTITEFVDKLFQQPKYIGIDRSSDTPLTKQQAKRLKKQKKERAKVIAALVFAGLVLIAFAAVFAWTLKNPTGNTGDDVETYEPVSTTTSATTTTAASTTQPDEVTAEPTIEVQQPEANIILPRFIGRRYESVLNQYGEKFTFVPEYEYLSIDYCEQLKTEGINPANGTIYQQDIEPDTLVAAGTEIKVKVSKGPTHVQLPEYEGKSVTEYIGELNKLNIRTSQQNEKTNDVAPGSIIRCSKEPNDYVDVENSETITVYIAVPIPEDELHAATEEAAQTAEAQDNAEGGIPVN